MGVLDTELSRPSLEPLKLCNPKQFPQPEEELGVDLSFAQPLRRIRSHGGQSLGRVLNEGALLGLPTGGL